MLWDCQGRANHIIDKIKAIIDFHIFAILEFDLLIGYPLDKLIQEKPSYGGLDEKLGETAFAIPIFHPEVPMAKQHPNHDQFEEVKFTFPFIAHPCEIEHLSPLSLEPKPHPSGHQNVVLDSGRDSTLILHDISLKKENRYAMDNLEAPTGAQKE